MESCIQFAILERASSLQFVLFLPSSQHHVHGKRIFILWTYSMIALYPLFALTEHILSFHSSKHIQWYECMSMRISLSEYGILHYTYFLFFVLQNARCVDWHDRIVVDKKRCHIEHSENNTEWQISWTIDHVLCVCLVFRGRLEYVREYINCAAWKEYRCPEITYLSWIRVTNRNYLIHVFLRLKSLWSIIQFLIYLTLDITAGLGVPC